MIRNWMSSLVETYDVCSKDSSTRSDKPPLVPIYHILNNAQITITLSSDAAIISAEVIPKDLQGTIIPCTEDSAGRTSGPRPHPLDDKLVYLAPDLKCYCDVKGDFVKSNSLYINQLESWCNSDYSNDKAKIVLQYLKSGAIIDDLLKRNILILNNDGKFASKKEAPGAPLFETAKIPGEQGDAFVRWAIDIPGDNCLDTWEDVKLTKDWINYVQSGQSDIGLCYITGNSVPLAKNNPSRIRNEADKAKLVSSNDKDGFTFRGRFETSNQAYGIGCESTQKAHSALRWLIGRQGYRQGDLCIIAWSVDKDTFSNPASDFSSILEIEEPAYTNDIAAKHIVQRLRGYNSDILDKDVMIMALDSATPGRMSIVTFRSELGEDLVTGLEKWHESSAWIHEYAKIKDENGKDKPIIFIGAPAPKDIAQAAYGLRADDKIITNAIKRILPCIIDGTRMPVDIMSSIINRACSPQSMERWEWRKVLSIACSTYKQFKGGKYEMSLENDRTSRDYLYGRLLAIADLMEGAALKSANEDRQTTAIRLMQRFSEFPYTTWKDIELALIPYASRLGKVAGYYEGKISEIMELFEGDDFRNNSKLSGEFLLAYHCQKRDQFKKKEIKEE